VNFIVQTSCAFTGKKVNPATSEVSGKLKLIKMENQLNISRFIPLDENELHKTSGGIFLLAMSLTLDIIIGLAIYGAFMEGYNDGRKAAG
jgi:hypothetical protein